MGDGRDASNTDYYHIIAQSALDSGASWIVATFAAAHPPILHDTTCIRAVVVFCALSIYFSQLLLFRWRAKSVEQPLLVKSYFANVNVYNIG